MKWLDNVLLVPPLGERPGHWHDKMRWEELSSEQFNFVTSQVGETIKELEPLLNTFFGQASGLIESELGLSPVSWPSTTAQLRSDEPEVEMISSSNGLHGQVSGSGTQPYSSSRQDISGARGSSQLFDGD